MAKVTYKSCEGTCQRDLNGAPVHQALASQISCEIHYEMAAMCLCFFDVKNATLDREKPGRSGSLSFLGFPSISYADQMLHSLPITSLNICTPYRPT